MHVLDNDSRLALRYQSGYHGLQGNKTYEFLNVQHEKGHLHIS
jgi:hypothetical protein